MPFILKVKKRELLVFIIIVRSCNADRSTSTSCLLHNDSLWNSCHLAWKW